MSILNTLLGDFTASLLGGLGSGPGNEAFRQAEGEQYARRQAHAQQQAFKPIYRAYGPPPEERSPYDDGDVIDVEPVEPKLLGE